MTSRRDFFTGLTTGAVALVMDSRRSAAQGAQAAQAAPQRGAIHDSVMVMDSTNLFAMDQGAAQSVRLPAKPGAKASMSAAARDELEHHIHCQCGCTLDVYTCRTTDFSCQVSPAMHRDVLALVEGGYGAQEILDAFTNVYGEKVLMAPKKSGFNLVAWITPGVALVVAAVGVSVMLRRWGGGRELAPATVGGSHGSAIGATADELARLEAAVKAEDDQ